MQSLKFSEFYTGAYADEGFELYIVKDSDAHVMYVGISHKPIWDRWFAGVTSHMDIAPNGKLFGKSHIGSVIERRLPKSMNWTIELWTKKDCFNFLEKEMADRDLERIDIKMLEPFMIEKLNPLYNVLHSGGYQEDPLVTKKLDDEYKKLFK
jgi:hypothetical protein